MSRGVCEIMYLHGGGEIYYFPGEARDVLFSSYNEQNVACIFLLWHSSRELLLASIKFIPTEPARI